MKVLDASQVYERIKSQIEEQVKLLSPLTLASLVIGKNYSSDVYRSFQEKTATQLGIEYLRIEMDEDVSLKDVLAKIDSLNKDEKITGIVANKPFPKEFLEDDIFAAISPDKDVEGLNPYNLGKLFTPHAALISPTVLSILEFLKLSQIKLYGKEAVIVGFSTLIGKPLALLLAKEFATVTITHIATYEAGALASHVGRADIVVSAVGISDLIKGEWIKKGAVVIDVGVASRDGKMAGDIEFEEAKKRAAFITPVKGGVGKLTSIFLFYNLVKLAGLKNTR